MKIINSSKEKIKASTKTNQDIIMKSFLTSIKTAVAALLVAILALPVAAQTQEVEMTPQLEAALQNYDSYSSVSFDGAIIVKQNYKWGLIDTCGTEIISCKYDFIGVFHEGLARVKMDGKYGYVNTRGVEVVPCKYDYVRNFYEGLARVTMGDYGDEKYGYVNTLGQEVIPCIYDNASSFSEGMAWVCSDDKYGFINAMGDVVVPFIYDYTGDFHEGLAVVKMGDSFENCKYGFINSNGKEIVPCKYDIAKDFNDGIAQVRLAEKWGCIDTSGNVVIPCKYDVMTDFTDGVCNVKLQGSYGTLDRNGTFIKEVSDSDYDLNLDHVMRYKEDQVIAPPEPMPEPMPEHRFEEKPEPEPVSNEVFKSAATMPSFPGGTGELMKFIAFNIRYPESAKDSYIQGKVIVQFVVEKDGSIGEVKVVRGVDKALDIEAVRLCKTLPRFNPGRNANGDPVRVWFTQPITFKLEGAN